MSFCTNYFRCTIKLRKSLKVHLKFQDHAWDASSRCGCERNTTNPSVLRAGPGDEEDGQAADERRHHQRQRRRRRRHTKVLQQQQQHVETGRAVSREHLGRQQSKRTQQPVVAYLDEALAGGHLRDDRRGEAHHGKAARPHVDDAASRLAALLAPHGQRRRRGPGADA